MLQPRIRSAICHQCRTLLPSRAPSTTSSARAYATATTTTSTATTSTYTPPSTSTTAASSSSNAAPSPSAGLTRQQKRGAITMRTYKPRTPGVRHLRRPINDHLWKGGPFRQLTFPKLGQGKGGRNNSGRITMRHHGGGHRRRIRTIDYARTIPGRHLVERIEYDPNRSAHIALLENTTTKIKSYIIAAEGMRAGDTVESFRSGIPKDLLKTMGGTVDPGVLAAKTAFRGNCLPMHMVPVGTQVYCVGSHPQRGAVFCRSAGTYATVVAKAEQGKGAWVTVRLQSGEVRKVDKMACATVGVASNPNHHFRQLGKAGRSRWLNIRPTVRGVAMNSVDHPHGGGRGKSKGNVHPVSVWGTPAKSGYKTRAKRNPNKYVVEERVRNQGKRRSKQG